MIKNQRITHTIFIIALLLGLFILLASVSGVHAASTVYVNATGGNDSNDGSINHPYKTIDQALKNVNINGTVKIANGIYKGKGNTDLTIDKNMKIIGQHQKKTIINGEGTNWIFTISKGIDVTIMNLTLTNGTAKNGGAIYNNGTCTVKYSTFRGNKATESLKKDDGGAAIYNNGICNVKHCTFTDNKGTGTYSSGGAIYNDDTFTMSDCIFTNNTAGWGGAIANAGTIKTLSACTFIDNIANKYGGAIYTYGICNVASCTFKGNNATYNGGAIYVNGDIFVTILTARFNRFVNNNAGTGNALYSYDGSLDARYNWWGSNTNPKNVSNLIAGQADKVDTDSWLVLTITPHKNTIDVNGKTIVTADLLHDNHGVYHDPASGHVHDGTVVTFSASSGTLNPITVELVNGSAVTTLAAHSEGKSIVRAAVDNQTVSTEVTVNPFKPAPVDPVKPIPVKPDSPNSDDNGTHNTNSNCTQYNTVHASSKIDVQKTGLPLNYLILGIFLVLGGLVPKRK